METSGSSDGLFEYPLSDGSVINSIQGSKQGVFKSEAIECTSKKSCSGKKASKRTRKSDVNDHDGNSETFHCRICNKVFYSKNGVNFHEKYTHNSPKIDCLVCKKSFKLLYDLDRHMNVHTGNRPFKCTDCSKTFVCNSSLNQHRRLKHIIGDIFKCSVCEKGFNKESDLERHSTVHSGAKAFECIMCAKKFSCKSSLKVHEKSHDGKKFACSFCDKDFYEKSDLKRHETIHTGIKPWKCKACGKGYSCKSTLGVHLRNRHTKKPTSDMFVYVKQTDSPVTCKSKTINEPLSTDFLCNKKSVKRGSLFHIKESDLQSDVGTVMESKTDNEDQLLDVNEAFETDDEHNSYKDSTETNPYISIEMVNDESQSCSEETPITLFQQGSARNRRKPKFVRKIEVMDNCIVMCEK